MTSLFNYLKQNILSQKSIKPSVRSTSVQSDYPQRRTKQGGTIRYHDSAGRDHRDDGPAVIYTNGNSLWMQHGKIHRIGGPALSWSSGNKRILSWKQDGHLHNKDGPATIIQTFSGFEYRYMQYGVFHRLDGPAEIIIVIENGEITAVGTTYYVEGRRLHKGDFLYDVAKKKFCKAGGIDSIDLTQFEREWNEYNRIQKESLVS